MEFTAKAIAEFLNGDVEGNPDEVVSDISKIEEGKKGTLAFLANPKYSKYLYSTNASIVLLNKDFNLEEEVSSTLIRVDDAYKAFASLLDLYSQSKPEKNGIEDLVFIDKSAEIGKNVYLGGFSYISKNVKIGENAKIHPQVYIGENCKIGNNTILYPGVKIYDGCQIGVNCIVHSGTVIGSDGFGFVPQEDADFIKIPQLGNVIIEDNVEIGSNVSIDRATIGSTILKKGVKLDNLIQIGHNVIIGENTVIVSQTGIAGSSNVGKNCQIGGQVGIVGHIEIANNVKIAAQSGVPSSIKKEGEILLGSPAANISDTRKSMVVYKQLPQLREKILELERELEKLKEKN